MVDVARGRAAPTSARRRRERTRSELLGGEQPRQSGVDAGASVLLGPLALCELTQFGQDDGQVVIDISNEGPEEGFTYEDLDQGKCQAWVWVTVSKFVPNDELSSKT